MQTLSEPYIMGFDFVCDFATWFLKHCLTQQQTHGAGPTEMVLQFHWDGHTWKGHLNINYSVKDFASESLDLTDLQVGARKFTFSDPSSAGVNKNTITFRGVKAAGELRGQAETNVEGKVDGSDYKLEMLGDWVLQRDRSAVRQRN